MENNETMLSIDIRVLQLWHNKLCSVEVKIINAANLMAVIQDIERILISQNNKEKENIPTEQKGD